MIAETAIYKTTAQKRSATKKLAIVSTCGDDWGGSEELWARAIPYFLEEGFGVTVLKDRINRHHPRYQALATSGVELKDLETYLRRPLAERVFIKAWKKIRRLDRNPLQIQFEKYLLQSKPDLVLVSQGINFDGLMYAWSCWKHHVPYVIVSQKAVEFYWPPAQDRPYMTEAFQHARKCFFVSRQNQVLTEEQFGFRFTNAAIVHNPIVLPKQPLPFPSTEQGFRLACVGRLFVIDKGQDILLRVLAQQKWKGRPLQVSFIGKGVDEEGLRAMSRLLGVEQITFTGQVEDMMKVWMEHHALVLPSRSEGLALVTLEAMAVGRPVIVTRAGGNEDVVQEGLTGFIGDATFDGLDRTLESAWEHRHEWEAMGRKGAEFVVAQMPESPEFEIAQTLTRMIYES